MFDILTICMADVNGAIPFRGEASKLAEGKAIVPKFAVRFTFPFIVIVVGLVVPLAPPLQLLKL